MEFKTLLTKPKIMALSGIIAMVCKLVMAGILAVILNLCITNEFFFWMFISYPIIALIVDVILYLNKDKIWTTLPNNVPSEWKTTPEQLLTYTKHLPKIRLMRFLTCWIVVPMIISDDSKGCLLLLKALHALAVGFFLWSLFDIVWVKKFKLTKPVLIRGSDEQQENLEDEWYEEMEEDDFDDISGQLARNCNATAVGSSAWFAQQHFHSR